MAAGGAKILIGMAEADLRGKQANLFRLASFDKKALVRTVSYRVLVLLGIPLAAVLLLSSLYGAPVIARVCIVVIALLVTPQLFGVLKVVSIAISDGIAFGSLDKSYLQSIDKKKRTIAFYSSIIPYLCTAVWLLVVLVAVLGWLP
jgi:uncharacterized membrane-anchored protein